MANVRTTFTSDDKDVQRALNTMIRQTDRLRDENRKLRQEAKRGADTAKGGMKEWAAGYITLQTAANLASSAIRAVVDENLALSDAIDEVARKADPAALKLRIQADLTEEELQAQLPNLKRELLLTPVVDSVEDAFGIQQQLYSVGFQKQDIESGAAMRAFLETQATLAQFGDGSGNGIEALQSTAAILRASGQELTADNLGSFGQKFARLFAQNPIQASDIPALVEATSSLKALGISEDERLAAFTTAQGLLGGQKGATALNQITAGLRGSTSRVDRLSQFGLDVSGFDLIGEGYTEALRNLNQQLAPLDAASRSQAIEAIFGREAGRSFLTLSSEESLASTEGIRRDLSQIGSGDALDTFRDSEVARDARLRLREELALSEVDRQRGISFAQLEQSLETFRAEIEATEGDRGVLENFNRGLDFAAISATIAAAKAAGQTPEAALSAIDFLDNDDRSGFSDRFREYTERNLLGTRRTARVATDGVSAADVDASEGRAGQGTSRGDAIVAELRTHGAKLDKMIQQLGQGNQQRSRTETAGAAAAATVTQSEGRP